MFTFLASAAIAAAPTQAQSAAMTAWTTCLRTYIVPRLPKEKTEMIVDGGLAACSSQENALHQNYVSEMGASTGNAVFAGVRFKAREHLLAFVAAGKAQRGYR